MTTIRLKLLLSNLLFQDCLLHKLTQCGAYEAEALGVAGARLPDSLFEGQPVDELIIVGGRYAEPDTIARLREHSHRVLVLVPGQVREHVFDFIAVGAQGCMLDDATFEELFTAVERIAAGQCYCAPELVTMLIQELAKHRKAAEPPPQLPEVDLTPREVEIATLIDHGHSNKQIARQLCLSLHTVKNHVHNILEKLQVRNRLEAANMLRRDGRLAPRGSQSARPIVASDRFGSRRVD